LGTIVQKLNLRLDQVMLGFLFSSNMFGWYSLAIKLVEMLNWIPDSIGLVLFPSVAGRDGEEAARITAWLMRLDLLIVSLGGVALAVLARPAIVLLYGREFLPSVAPLLVSIPGIILLSVVKVVTKYFAGQGKPEISTTCTAIGFVAGGAVLYPLTLKWGMVGAAIASDVGYAAFAVSAVCWFSRMSGLPLAQCLIPRFSDVRQLLDRLSDLPVLSRIKLHMEGVLTGKVSGS
jgi:O-antigen/teichoic acid export membrane protein